MRSGGPGAANVQRPESGPPGSSAYALERLGLEQIQCLQPAIRASVANSFKFLSIIDDLMHVEPRPQLDEWSLIMDLIAQSSAALEDSARLLDVYRTQSALVLKSLAEIAELEHANAELRAQAQHPPPRIPEDALLAERRADLPLQPPPRIAEPPATVQGGLNAVGGTEPTDGDSLPPGATTLMIRNIPARCSVQDLLDMWPPNGSYDLLHLPFSAKQHRPSGYAFVNFTSYEAAVAFRQCWNGTLLEKGGKSKRLSIMASATQGFEENILRCGSASIASERYVPVVFNGAAKLDFQAVLAAVRASGPGLARHLRPAAPPGTAVCATP